MNSRRGTFVMAVILCTVLSACTPLPSEWRDAAAVEAFTQSDCTGRAGELRNRPGERIAAQVSGKGRLRVEYRDAHFRCKQRVAGYAKVTDATIEVLVQPVDMSPSAVTKCDCLYDIAFEVPRLAAGTYDVTVHRRWDDRNGTSEPVRIGTARVAVP